MWTQFIYQNIHFALNFFTALMLFGVFWLYFDAWLEKKPKRDIPKLAGLILLALSFVFHAASVEGSLLTSQLLSLDLHNILVGSTRLAGYLLLIIGVFNEPIQPKLDTKGLTAETWKSAAFLGQVKIFELITWAPVIYVWLALGVGLLYLRRATTGLERHLKPVAIAFFIFAASELTGLGAFFRDTDNVMIFNLTAPFGLLWRAEHLLLLITTFILGRWVWQYLLTRLQSQLFMIFTTSILLIFLITTAAFTGLLLRNIQEATTLQLATDVKVLKYAIESKQAEILSDARVMAQNPQVLAALTLGDQDQLVSQAENYLLSKNLSQLIITDANAQVLARGEDSSLTGDSISSDPLVQRALLGEELASIVVVDGALSPVISVRGISAVRRPQTLGAEPVESIEGDIIGLVITASAIDNTFVDGLKNSTGLDASIYGGNLLAATTLLSADGKSRRLGSAEEDPRVTQQVLDRGLNHTGTVNLFNVPYFAAYQPLKDVDDVAVGMLFVGSPQYTVFQAASRSIELTFIVAAALILLTVYPSYRITKYIIYQIK